MALSPADTPMASAFSPATEAQWRSLVDKVLKGGPFERLIGKTYDGIAVAPLYPRADAAPRAIRAEAGPWRVLTRIDHPDVKSAHAAALTDLENGATGLQLVFAGSCGANGFGLADVSGDAISALLDGVFLDAGVRLELDLSPQTKDAALALAALVEARKINPALTDIGFGFDPMGVMALAGGTPVEWTHLAPMTAGMAKHLVSRGFGRHIFAADGRVIHSAGGTEAQELCFAISSALAYLRALDSAGVELEAARRMISFRLAADADEFLTLAKFRALRRLWARVEESCGLTPEPLHLHAETAWRMTSQRDPWVNILRATVATFSAGLGGADSISVTPFTQALGLPDDFARRIARNTQLVLIEESNLGRVADPAAGAGGFEALTNELCEKAWSLFGEIEKSGGLYSSLVSGAFQSKVAAARAVRAKNIARRRDALTGASEFPNIHEAPVDVLAPIPTVTVQPAMPISFSALTPQRDATPFEALRDRADALAKNDARPRIFLANLGPISAFTARAMFAKNFFEAGGIEALSNDGFESAADLASAFKTSGAAMACLCSSDGLYAERAAAAAQALKDAGATRIYLAGRPGELEGPLKEAGVAEFVFAGSDLPAVLENAFTAAR